MYHMEKEMVIQQKNALTEDVMRLTDYIASAEFQTIDDYNKSLIKKQLVFMTMYLNTINERIDNFTGIVYEPTVGEELIGWFGTERNQESFMIKLSASILVDNINRYGKNPRRAATAKTHAELAAMMGVKSLF